MRLPRFFWQQSPWRHTNQQPFGGLYERQDDARWIHWGLTTLSGATVGVDQFYGTVRKNTQCCQTYPSKSDWFHLKRYSEVMGYDVSTQQEPELTLSWCPLVASSPMQKLSRYQMDSCSQVAHILSPLSGTLDNSTVSSQALSKYRPVVFFLAHGESSTGVLHPLDGIGQLCHKWEAVFKPESVSHVELKQGQIIVLYWSMLTGMTACFLLTLWHQ